MNSDGTDQRQLTFGLGSDYPDANVPHWSLDSLYELKNAFFGPLYK